ncbi:MAG: peptidoglycan DD-metalloendopeptidase family protein [bacterium]
MKKTVSLVFFLFIVLSMFSLGFNHAYAIECGDQIPTDSSLLNDYINSCNNKINESKGQQATLAAAIAYFTQQINLTQAQINQTTQELNKLNLEIADLTGKIESIDYSLVDLTKLFVNRVRASYIQQKTFPVLSILSTQDLPNFLSNLEYLNKVRDHDQSIMLALEKSRLAYDEQKTAKEEKQQEVEALQKKLSSQRSALSQQQNVKQSLLTVTKNNEAKYQELLSQALAEKAAIEKALVSGVKVGPVKRGDPIALVGNSGYPGCSTGKHLHFEVRQGGTWTNPGAYLESKTVHDEGSGSDISLGSGSWSWPIEAPIRLTQSYGSTPYSWRYTYSGGIHTGLDLVPGGSDVIRAPEGGTLYRSAQSCGSSTINIVYIDHGNDLISLYLHVQ